MSMNDASFMTPQERNVVPREAFTKKNFLAASENLCDDMNLTKKIVKLSREVRFPSCCGNSTTSSGRRLDHICTGNGISSTSSDLRSQLSVNSWNLRTSSKNFLLVLEKAAEIVLHGDVLIYPTDTVYGIGGDATSEKTVQRIKQIKKKTVNAPFSVIFSDIEMIKRYCEVNEWQEEMLKKYLPGPYTFILKEKINLPTNQNSKIGIRMPESEFTCQLVKIVKKPIVTTSANLSGEQAPIDIEGIDKRLLKLADLIIDGGTTRYKGASTVVDLVEKKTIRKGMGRDPFTVSS